MDPDKVHDVLMGVVFAMVVILGLLMVDSAGVAAGAAVELMEETP